MRVQIASSAFVRDARFQSNGYMARVILVARALWFIYSLSSVSSRCIHSRPSIRGRFSYIVPADLGFGMSCALTLDAEEARGRASSAEMEV